ncbi:MAG: alpha/beta hydrolase-fold protein [Planctomycetota bacterium]|nr:alpha/beta hydrolase-fold protein [Planctomycetota bacterium]MDA1210966.1 alpha/beta hydrolase-fold protein [Planctomycetota bacterium]
MLLISLLSADPLTPGNHMQALDIGGRERSYLVHVPKGYDPETATPVVLTFHGAGMNAWMMAAFSGMSETSDKNGFVVVYPNGTGKGPFQVWNAGGFAPEIRQHMPDDVAYVEALLDDLETVINVDKQRVFACGMSNGAMMSYRLAAEMSKRIAAIAPVAGTIAISESKPERPVAVLHFHGTVDNFVSYERNDESSAVWRMRGVKPSIETWVKLNECDETPAVDVLSNEAADQLKVVRTTYSGGKEGTEVVLVTIEGGGHTWPGRRPGLKILGKSALNIPANDMIWAFFEKHPMK